MVTRTKSFFDHDHTGRPRPGQWTRRPYTSVQQENVFTKNPSKSPIPPTKETKSKLHAFPFLPDQPDETEESAHDRPVPGVQDHCERDSANNSSCSGHIRRRDTPFTQSNPPGLPYAKTFPCTPGARLPLEDLIGNCDEPQKEGILHTSPDEQIGWIPNSSSDLITPNQRKRKRAKSSSPATNSSSQPGTTSAFFGDEKLSDSAKRTPAADPVADLWQRYATSKQAGDTSKTLDIDELIPYASPRPIETPVRGGTFRRWASTGNVDFSNKNKRRCTSRRGGIINVYQDPSTAALKNESKVATMVHQMQRIQETLAAQQLEQERSIDGVYNTTAADAPSSSSPLPETGLDAFKSPTTRSPLRSKQPNLRIGATVSLMETKPASQALGLQTTQSGGVRTSNTHLQVSDSLGLSGAGPLHLQSKAPLPAYKRPSINRRPSQPKAQQVVLPPPPAMDLDEFGDDTFDLTADDLDELLTQRPRAQRTLYDIPAHPDPPAQRDPVTEVQQVTSEIDADDEFGSDIDDDSFAAAEFCATQARRTSEWKRNTRKDNRNQDASTSHAPPPRNVQQSIDSTLLQRYVVKQIVGGEYTNDGGQRCEEKVVLAEDPRSLASTAITLRGSWVSTPICSKDILHVVYIPRFHDDMQCTATTIGQVVVSDDEWSPFLIVHPDHMLSATTVADSFDCIRKAVLQDRIKATGETSKAMVYGKILHQIFQQAMSANQWGDMVLAELVERIVQAHAEGLWELGMRDTNLAAEEVKAKMGELSAWAAIFIADTPSDTSLVGDRQGERVWMSISKLIAIEEHIWSPRFGLKGNIDATVETILLDDPDVPAKRLIVPFEVKTGRTTHSPAHRAQTALYTLLLSDRYDLAVDAGILYYLESSSMSRIAPPLTEVRQMIQQRNRLSAYIYRARHPSQANQPDDHPTPNQSLPTSQHVEESGLPGVLKNPFKCGRCYALSSCFAYHALVEKGTADSAGMVDDPKKNHSLIWNEAVGHLLSLSKHTNKMHALQRWFTKWDRLLTFEEDDLSRPKRELWTMSSSEREAVGRCFGRLTLARDLTETTTTMTTEFADGIEGGGGKINRFAYSFKRASPLDGYNFTEGSQLTVGEPIVVSSEEGQWALANGYIVAVTKQEITVAVDRKLGDSRERLDGFDGMVNQAFRGVMTVSAQYEKERAPLTSQPLLYRLDKDEFSNGLALVRNNLVTLMSAHPIHTKLRHAIILNDEPTFGACSPLGTSQLQHAQLGEMNDDQHSAVTKVLSAHDYALLLGMPGTGKTTTIAHIIRALLAEGKSILLTSFTHTAVDNILLKIRSVAPPGGILRIGVPAKINSQVQEFCQLAATPRDTIEEIEQAYMESQIVAATCMGTNHALFRRRAFDVCIVDEASQITLPVILGPLLRARRFVLVGDHFQLPPLVQNKAALEGGLDVSLFRQLSEGQPHAVAALGRQYRMCEEIMTLSNELIYGGKLKCGNATVATRTLQVCEHVATALNRFHGPSLAASETGRCLDPAKCWLAHAVAPQHKVIFANTDACDKNAMETLTSGKNITNELEATLSAQIVLSLLTVGVPASEIGIVTLYRSQLTLIRQLYKKAGIPNDVEIDSADRFQGRDKECIVLSMVRSNEAGIVGDLLKDWRRVNVALTRARSKLVVLGSHRTLKNNELLEKLLTLIGQKGWNLDLPKSADELHAFSFSTQLTQSLLTAESTPREKCKKASPVNGSPSQPAPSKQTRPGPPQSTAGGSMKKRSPLKSTSGNGNIGPRRIKGKTNQISQRMRSAREQVVVDIFEDLIGEEF